MDSNNWQSWIDEQIQEIIGDGNTAHLDNAKQALQFDDELVPAEQRSANKIMKDNNVVPTWMMLGQDIDTSLTRIRTQLQEDHRRYLGLKGDADRNHNPDEQAYAEELWRMTQKVIASKITKHNRLVLDYNLTVPTNIPHKSILRLQDEIERLKTSL